MIQTPGAKIKQNFGNRIALPLPPVTQLVHNCFLRGLDGQRLANKIATTGGTMAAGSDNSVLLQIMPLHI